MKPNRKYHVDWIPYLVSRLYIWFSFSDKYKVEVGYSLEYMKMGYVTSILTVKMHIFA